MTSRNRIVRPHARGAGFSVPVALALLPVATFAATPTGPAHPGGWQYVSPLPDSRYVSTAETIVLRDGRPLDRASLGGADVRAVGERSGEHLGTLVLAADGRTLVFRPRVPFVPSERVRVSVAGGLRAADGQALRPIAFAFSTGRPAPAETPVERLARLLGEEGIAPSPGAAMATHRAPSVAHARPARPADALPAGYPPISVYAVDHPDTGAIFFAPFDFTFLAERGNTAIVDNRGQPLFWRSWPGYAMDFTRLPDGRITFYTLPATWLVLDSTYAVVDSFKAGNGYDADMHDLQLLPNGHALLLAYEREIVPMDSVVVGGDPAAVVASVVIQELDADKNVVFQWRGFDHFQVTDVDTTCTENLRATFIDAVHANAVELDQDGNILLSSRHLNEITKIDRTTGDIIWRLGLHATNNVFAFPNDTRGFRYQHDIRRLPNGDVSLFGNDNCIAPTYSHALEYSLDEVNHVATLVSEYRATPDQFSPFMGNVQHREGGGITIGWGGVAPDPKLTDLHADGTVALQIGLGNPGLYSYRGFRFPWATTAFAPGVDSLAFGGVVVGDTSVTRIGVTNRLATTLTLDQFVTTDTSFTVVQAPPLTLAPGATDSLDVRFTPTLPGAHAAGLYLRAVSDTDLVARVVELTGSGDGSVLDIDDFTHAEGDTGTTAFTFDVHLRPATDHEVTVAWATEDSSATTAAGDYLPGSGVLTFAPGDTLATIMVGVPADTVTEPTSVFHVALSAPTGAQLGRAVARGVIVNDDPWWLGVDDGRPRALALAPVRPNPARGDAGVSYDLPRAGHVLLGVYDVRGRRVATLVDGDVEAGRHSLTWRPRDAAPGVYWLRLRTGADARVRSFVLLR